MIVITAPTGQIGHHLVDNLLAAGERVRVVVRNPGKLDESVRGKVDIVEGSHGDTAVINRALEGAKSLFWLPPLEMGLSMEANFLDFTRPAAQAIRRHGVERVVSITALGRGTPWESCAGLATCSIRMDDMLWDTGVAFRGVAMPSFMDNILQQLALIKDQGRLSGPLDADKKFPFTATRDMTAVSAKLLTDDTLTGQAEAPLVGPEDLSFNDIAALASEVLQRPIVYEEVPFDAWQDRLRSRGMHESIVRGYGAMMRAKNEGLDNVLERTPAVTGPTTYRQWMEERLKPAVAG